MISKYYLAHPFGSRKWVREIELELENRLGVKLINPFYDDDGENPEPVDSEKINVYDWMKKLNPNKVIERDLDLITHCNGVIAFITDDRSYGTTMEIVYAHMMFKPVYLVVMNGYEEHPWLKYHSTEIFTDVSELEEFLKVIGGGNDGT